MLHVFDMRAGYLALTDAIIGFININQNKVVKKSFVIIPEPQPSSCSEPAG